jgi:hypothetical protein
MAAIDLKTLIETSPDIAVLNMHSADISDKGYCQMQVLSATLAVRGDQSIVHFVIH